jgi:hypothetical protein
MGGPGSVGVVDTKERTASCEGAASSAPWFASHTAIALAAGVPEWCEFSESSAIWRR